MREERLILTLVKNFNVNTRRIESTTHKLIKKIKSTLTEGKKGEKTLQIKRQGRCTGQIQMKRQSESN
jgi:hypothetical protein